MSSRRLSEFSQTKDDTFPYQETTKKHHTLVSSTPRGVLAVHVKRAHIYTLDPATNLFQRSAKKLRNLNLYVVLESSKQIKYSHVCQRVTPPKTIVFDDMKHFLLWVTNNRKDPENHFKINLVGYTTAHVHKVVAQRDVHLYDIVRKLYMVETLDFHMGNTLIAELEIEFCFAYGEYGYGYSNQLENRHRTPQEQISHSMFFRPEPPADRLQEDHAADVMASIHVGHPSFINFTQKVKMGETAREFRSEMESGLLDANPEEPTLVIVAIRKRMHAMQTAFAKLNLRRDRIGFLRNLIFGHKTDIVDFSTEGRKLKHRTAEMDANATGQGGSKMVFAEEEEDEEEAKEGDVTLGQNVEAMTAMLNLAPGLITRRGTLKVQEPKLQEADSSISLAVPEEQSGLRARYPPEKVAFDTNQEQPKLHPPFPRPTTPDSTRPTSPARLLSPAPQITTEDMEGPMGWRKRRLSIAAAFTSPARGPAPPLTTEDTTDISSGEAKRMQQQMGWRKRRLSIADTFRTFVRPTQIIIPRIAITPSTPVDSDEDFSD